MQHYCESGMGRRMGLDGEGKIGDGRSGEAWHDIWDVTLLLFSLFGYEWQEEVEVCGVIGRCVLIRFSGVWRVH